MQNITLSLPRTLLRRIEIVAARRETSVSALVAASLEDVVRQEGETVAAARRLLARAGKGFDLGTQGRIVIPRDEVHAR